MKIFMMTDLEGVSGVDTMSQVSDEGTPGYRYACERLMHDVNAAVDGCYLGGASKVYVLDGHGTGKNFIDGMLHKDAEQVSIKKWESVIQSGQIDAVMKVGTHPMAGTINGFLDHTRSSRSWYRCIVNGRECGDIALQAIYFGWYNLAFVMMSGDEAACVEAKAFLGDIECAVVKHGIGRNRARLVDLDESLERIKNAACAGVKRAKEIKIYKPIMPLEIKAEFYRTDMCEDVIARCPGVERINARTIRRILDKIQSYGDLCDFRP